MESAFAEVFALLKAILATQTRQLAVKTDTAAEYTLVTKSGSPFPQHKGEPLFLSWCDSPRLTSATT